MFCKQNLIVSYNNSLLIKSSFDLHRIFIFQKFTCFKNEICLKKNSEKESIIIMVNNKYIRIFFFIEKKFKS